MEDRKVRQSGGGKLSRSETVTVRLDPRLRYMAEMAARKQRRTLSSFIEWAVEESINRTIIYEGSGQDGDESKTFAEVADKLWDVDEVERLARLAILHPDLLTYDEQKVWKIIKDCFILTPAQKSAREYDWDVLEIQVFPRIRELWPHLMMVWDEPPSVLGPWIEREQKESLRLQELRNHMDNKGTDVPPP
ncbi:MAG: hypothetical protein HQM06_17635 [Magnetococcales bacterium]|nr:hypothetical protein [Magnetococcales bacterium]